MTNEAKTTNNETAVKKYSKLSGYNRFRIWAEIEKLITADGGEIIRNRYKKEVTIQAYTSETDPKYIAKIDALPPIHFIGNEHWDSNTIEYIKSGYYYSISYDDNPFFPITFTKIKVDENGDYIGKRYLYSSDPPNEASFRKTGELCLSLAYDNIFKICTDDEVKEMAIYHYNQIITVIENGHEAQPYTERKRVANNYNGGWHWETITDKTKCNIYNKI